MVSEPHFTESEALEYINKRLDALKGDIAQLDAKSVPTMRRQQIAANIGVEVSRIRWALTYVGSADK